VIGKIVSGQLQSLRAYSLKKFVRARQSRARTTKNTSTAPTKEEQRYPLLDSATSAQKIEAQ
jgi:hypothetical protein